MQQVDKVATSSYYYIMKPMKTVGIKELKNNLSAWLREVRGGATILVTDRNEVVAELQEPYGRASGAGGLNPLLLGWARDGIVTLPLREKTPLEPSPVKLSSEIVHRLLEEDREEPGL